MIIRITQVDPDTIMVHFVEKQFFKIGSIFVIWIIFCENAFVLAHVNIPGRTIHLL